EVRAVVLAEPPARLQLCRRRAGLLPQHDECFHEAVEPLLRADAREEADRERAFAARVSQAAVAREGDARLDNVNALARDAEVTSHVVRVVAAGADVRGHRLAVRADLVDALLAGGDG